MNSLVLAGIVKRVYPNFNMSTFENRLKLQKIVYLLQAYGINLGYTFTLYHYGPYCLELMKTAYYVEDFAKIKEVGFEDTGVETKFKAFLEKITPYKNDVNWLEAASTLHLFKKLYPSESKRELIKRVKTIKSKFGETYLEEVYGGMTEWL